jgi:hypothetical protein
MIFFPEPSVTKSSPFSEKLIWYGVWLWVNDPRMSAFSNSVTGKDV